MANPTPDVLDALLEHLLETQYAQLPEETIQRVNQRLLDSVGVGVAGHRADDAASQAFGVLWAVNHAQRLHQRPVAALPELAMAATARRSAPAPERLAKFSDHGDLLEAVTRSSRGTVDALDQFGSSRIDHDIPAVAVDAARVGAVDPDDAVTVGDGREQAKATEGRILADDERSFHHHHPFASRPATSAVMMPSESQ